MTISQEAVEAAARAMCDDGCNWDNKLHGHRKTMWLDRAEIALKAALPFLALRPAPSQSDEELWLDLCEKPDRTSPEDSPTFGLINYEEFMGYLATVRAEATLAGAAAELEACAKVLDHLADVNRRNYDLFAAGELDEAASAIRARKP